MIYKIRIYDEILRNKVHIMNWNVALAYYNRLPNHKSSFSQIIKWYITDNMEIPVASRTSATGEPQPPAFHVA